jgi:predicted pyridoxine 5'-phosphate oxidase superfamily flavin-nucleotide-binding protein
VPGFLKIAGTPDVVAAQVANGSGDIQAAMRAVDVFEGLTAQEAQFVAARDSFFMATVSQDGWPYVQHRGGPPGFLRVIDPRTLAFADFRGNRQYLSVGNLAGAARCALILVDYPNRARLKLFARVEVRDLGGDPELARQLATPGYKARPERALVLHVEGTDWNCAQHITQRFTAAELEPVSRRLAELEAENAILRTQLAAAGAA